MAKQKNKEPDSTACDNALGGPVSLLDRIEMLPNELIDHIIQVGLFSEPLGSHDALHTFQIFCQDEAADTLMKQRIAVVFGSQWIRQQIEREWQLCSNFNDAKNHLDTSSEPSGVHLASSSILHCFSCFQFLLRHKSVQASSYFKTGKSFFSLAVQNETAQMMELIASFMEDEQLFQPYNLHRLEGPRSSSFQVSTMEESWFRAVWKRASLLRHISPSRLTALDIFSICQLASVSLADELYKRGVDLGGSHYEGDGFPRWWSESPGWWGILTQRDPVPLMVRFRELGHQPPAGYLLGAARCRNIPALSWILERTESYRDWQEAAYTAAEDVFSLSGDVLEFILQHPSSNRRENSTFIQDICIKIIDSVCWQVQRPQPPWTNEVDGQNSWPSTFQLEENALLKLRVLERFKVGGVDVVGLKVQTRHAGLHRLTAELESLERDS